MTVTATEKRPLLTFRAVTGLASSVPVLGLALPLGAFLAGIAAIETKRAKVPKALKWVVAAAALGVLVYVLEWAFRGGPFPSSGVGQFGVAIVLVLGYARLAPDVPSAALLVAAVALGNVLYFVLVPQENTAGSIVLLWKYGISYPVAVLAIFWACRRSTKQVWAASVLGLLGVVSTFLDTRSTALVCFAAAAIVLAKGHTSRTQTIRTAIGGALLLAAVAVALPQAIEAGAFGAPAQQRTLAQTEETSNPLLGGRKEPPLSIVAIVEKPWFGWGSAQNIDSETFSRASELAQRLGMGSTSNYLPIWIREEGRVSLHSVALNAWVEGGIATALFPFGMVLLSGWAMLRTRGRWAPLVALTGMATIWSMLFSPWGASQVVLMSVWAVLAARAVEESTNPEVDAEETARA